MPYRDTRTRRRAPARWHTEADLGRRASVDFFEADQPARNEQAADGSVPRHGLRDRAELRGEVDLRARQRAQGEDVLAAGSLWHRRSDNVPERRCGRARQSAGAGDEPAEDVILVAVCLWQKSVKGQGPLLPGHVATGRQGRNPDAVPWSAPASEYPGVRTGHASRPHQLRHRASACDPSLGQPEQLRARPRHPPVPPGDARPVREPPDEAITRVRARACAAVRGQPAPADRREGNSDAAVPDRRRHYQLPVSFYFFTPPRMLADGKADTTGQKKNFVADGHAVMFTSNGQVHHHWSPVEFRERTKTSPAQRAPARGRRDRPAADSGAHGLLHSGSFRRASERGSAAT